MLVIAAGYGFHRFMIMLEAERADDAARNQLRNLYFIAKEHSAKQGNRTTVQISELDQAALNNAGIHQPLSGAFPSAITVGSPLQRTSFDGRRTVVFDPAQ